MTRKDKKKVATAKARMGELPPPTHPPLPPLPSQRRYTMTEIAALCSVTEQTVRRWWHAKLIPEPQRMGRQVFWMGDVVSGIVETYQMTGRPSVLAIAQPENK